MPDVEFNNKILILLCQPKGKSAGNMLDHKQLWNCITKTILVGGLSVSATQHLHESASARATRVGAEPNIRKKGRKTNWLTCIQTWNLAMGEQLSAQARKTRKRLIF